MTNLEFSIYAAHTNSENHVKRMRDLTAVDISKLTP